MGAVGNNSGGMPSYDYDNPTHFDDNPEHTLKWMKNEKLSNYNEWEDSLTPDQLEAIQLFTGTAYMGSFKALYGTSWDEMTDHQKKVASDLYDALNNFELKKPIIVYRQADTKIFGEDHMSADDIKKLEGGIVHSNGFMSTAAATHGHGVESNQVEMEITIPKSIGAGAFVAYKSSASTYEHEFMLNNNGFFKINKVTKGVGHNGATKVEMQWIGQSKDQIFSNSSKGAIEEKTVKQSVKKKKG